MLARNSDILEGATMHLVPCDSVQVGKPLWDQETAKGTRTSPPVVFNDLAGGGAFAISNFFAIAVTALWSVKTITLEAAFTELRKVHHS